MGKKLHVTLVRGPIVYLNTAQNNEATPSIAYAYISAYLHKHGYETTLVDAIGEALYQSWPLELRPGYSCIGLRFEEILERIPAHTDVIGFSCMFSGEWPVMRHIINTARQKFPNQLFVAGGEHVTAATEYSLRDCPALDVCVRGEGEVTFANLLESYLAEGKAGFEKVGSIGYLDESGEYRANGDKPSRLTRLGTDEMPWPHWPEGYLEKYWAAGKSYGVASERDMPLLFSRGCPYRCAFCSSPQMWTTRYVLRDVEDVIAEIKHYIARYDITSVQPYDLTAITKKSWAVKLLRRVQEEGIRLQWSLPSGTRSEVLDEEVLTLLRDVGCKYLVYAPESGSERTLVRIRKQVTLSKLTDSVLTASRLGIKTRVNLIMGFPGETWRDVFDTILYGLKMAFKGVDDVPLFVFSPYPGSELFALLQSRNEVTLNDDYFYSLASMNGDYLSVRQVVSYNPSISAWKLGFVRAFFIVLNYSVTYLCYPHRILRTIGNLFSKKADTVFEHRLKDKIHRLFLLKRPPGPTM